MRTEAARAEVLQINPTNLKGRELFFYKIVSKLIKNALCLIDEITEGRFPITESTKPFFKPHILVFKLIRQHNDQFVFTEFRRYFESIANHIYLKIISDDLDHGVVSKLINIETYLRQITSIIPYKEKVVRTQILPAWVILNFSLPKYLPISDTLIKISNKERTNTIHRAIGSRSERDTCLSIIQKNGPVIAMIQTLRLSKLDVKPNCVDGIAVQSLVKESAYSVALLSIFFVIYCYIYKQSTIALSQNGMYLENNYENLDITIAYSEAIELIKSKIQIKGLRKISINQLCPANTSQVLYLRNHLSMIEVPELKKFIDLDLPGFIFQLQNHYYFSGLQIKTADSSRNEFDGESEYHRAITPSDLDERKARKPPRSTLEELFRIF